MKFPENHIERLGISTVNSARISSLPRAEEGEGGTHRERRAVWGWLAGRRCKFQSRDASIQRGPHSEGAGE